MREHHSSKPLSKVFPDRAGEQALHYSPLLRVRVPIPAAAGSIPHTQPGQGSWTAAAQEPLSLYFFCTTVSSVNPVLSLVNGK